VVGLGVGVGLENPNPNQCGKPQRKKDKFGNFQRKFVVAATHGEG